MRAGSWAGPRGHYGSFEDIPIPTTHHYRHDAHSTASSNTAASVGKGEGKGGGAVVRRVRASGLLGSDGTAPNTTTTIATATSGSGITSGGGSGYGVGSSVGSVIGSGSGSGSGITLSEGCFVDLRGAGSGDTKRTRIAMMSPGKVQLIDSSADDFGNGGSSYYYGGGGDDEADAATRDKGTGNFPLKQRPPPARTRYEFIPPHTENQERQIRERREDDMGERGGARLTGGSAQPVQCESARRPDSRRRVRVDWQERGEDIPQPRGRAGLRR